MLGMGTWPWIDLLILLIRSAGMMLFGNCILAPLAFLARGSITGVEIAEKSPWRMAAVATVAELAWEIFRRRKAV
jgi:hypothetical protein